MWKILRFRIVGETPLLMHNGDLADYRYKWTKAIAKISGKRKKTEEDHEEMARLEWCGGLYLKDGKPCIPGFVLESALTGPGGPARRVKMGRQAAAGVIVTGDFPLEYDGPTDIEEMWRSGNFELRSRVKVKQSKIIRTRPMFRDWAATVEVKFNPKLVNQEDVKSWMHVLGEEVGIGDWRPKFGQFRVVEVQEVA
jgi:hypothetical protein